MAFALSGERISYPFTTRGKSKELGMSGAENQEREGGDFLGNEGNLGKSLGQSSGIRTKMVRKDLIKRASGHSARMDRFTARDAKRNKRQRVLLTSTNAADLFFESFKRRGTNRGPPRGRSDS